MVAILFQCPWESAGDWLAALGAAMPAEEVRLYPDELGDPAEIEVALVWKPPHGLLTGLPKLRAILALGAGVDALLRDADLPAGVPLARLVDPSMPTRMAEYVAGAVLYYHLHHDVYAARQARGEWLREPPRDAAGRRVGLLGLGAMGLAAARALTGLGFAVAGWRRADAAVPGLTVFHGAEGFMALLAQSEIVVGLLPRTAETSGLMDARAFAAMPTGSHFINCGRGELVVEADLLAALDSGRLAGATLDVLQSEPPPPEHPFWRHPKIRLSPHAASITDIAGGARLLADQVARLRRGQPLANLVDPARGY